MVCARMRVTSGVTAHLLVLTGGSERDKLCALTLNGKG